MFDFLIQGGTVVSPEGSHLMNIGIADGKVCELLSPHLVPPAKNIIQAEGMFIIPGLIDEHIHFNDPGTTFREDFEHATAACAVGGITTAIAMPTNMPLVLTPNSFQRTLDAYSHRGYVDYAIHGGLECGLFKEKRPELDIVSMGPEADGAHTPDETLDLTSFGRFYDFLKGIC